MQTPTELEQTLTALERAGWEALASGRGVAFYQDVFLDEGFMLFPVGAFGKADALHGLANAPPWGSYELLRYLRVLPLSERTASVVYAVAARPAGQAPGCHERHLRVETGHMEARAAYANAHVLTTPADGGVLERPMTHQEIRHRSNVHS